MISTGAPASPAVRMVLPIEGGHPIDAGAPEAARPLGLSGALLVFGGWLLLGLLETAKEWAGWQVRGTPRPLPLVAAVNLPFWLYWAALTPLVVVLGRRFPVAGPRWARSVAIHAAFSLAAALGHAAATAAFAVLVLAPAGQLSDPSFLGQFRPLAEGYVLLEVLVYWMILAAARAVDADRRLGAARVSEAGARAAAARSEARAAEARLQALRMEVDPHFLFNSLNAVSSLVRRGDGQSATDMLARLGELLRVTLRYGRSGMVSLGRELEIVGEYLGIEEVRFGDRLTVSIDATTAARAAAVPPLILQPLVENAIRHGVAPIPGAVAVRIRARRTGDRLQIEVCDSGRGPRAGDTIGTGLRNTVERLREEFGGGARFTLDSALDGGGRALLDLPWSEVGGGLPEGSP